MNKLALSHIDKAVACLREQSHSVIKNVLAMSNVPSTQLQQAMAKLAAHGRIAFHFHPDRLDSRGLTVAQGLLKDGIYKSQFETHTSNGHLSPELGGSRDHWENELFGNAYSGIKHRPKYGALDLGLSSFGPAPRFGSCYLLSKPKLLNSCSFCYLDSYRLPKERGTLNCFDAVLAALLSEAFERQSAIGKDPLTPAQLVEHLCHLDKRSKLTDIKGGGSNLDHYIEAQVHADVSLEQDIDLLVIDPSYKGTSIGEQLATVARVYQLELTYHSGYRMALADVPVDFRGPDMPQVATYCLGLEELKSEELNDDERQILTPYKLGQASLQCEQHLPAWQERTAHRQQQQNLKLLWHVLVKFGSE
ncbi:DUF3626 domain-containing protein [Shewanella sp. WXL01]|uniref:DUF3626 domain-containing protein n=1 Tax=Shewanella sp. WXL01 TaxID=2709721 RepID=UPI0014383417|nr:DUF3626 domain-containing protein [Shewanella sp. WXL01]NKF51297.1 DUF3626 domain-containing protein [Shewanella sp. WXL01]